MRARTFGWALGGVALGAGCLALLPPGRGYERAYVLAPPFAAESGQAFTVALQEGLAGDDASDPQRSRAGLFENGVALGPAHSSHADIRSKGAGAFSHWQGAIYFSTSDRTDPNTNGRRYELRVRNALPLALHFAALIVAFGSATILLHGSWAALAGARSRTRRWGHATIQIAGTFALLEGAAWILAERHLMAASAAVRTWHAHLFDAASVPVESAAALYAPHHYLNYALDPGTRHGGVRQNDGQWLIRRSEPIRPRSAVRWRGLVLGGSTTFGEPLDREEDTWVHRLEVKVRAELGGDVDVINGGVSGYTVLENLLHYVALLTHLDPDVIVLYVGINDVMPRLFATLQPDYRNYRKPWGGVGAFPAPVPGLDRLHCYRLWYLLRHMRDATFLHIDNYVNRTYPAIADWEAALARNGADIYRTHLANLVRLLQAQGRRVVIVPQHFAVIDAARDGPLLNGVREHNAASGDVARELAVPFLAQAIDAAAFVAGDCFDNCHFNAQGSEKMAALVMTFLRDNQLLPGR